MNGKVTEQLPRGQVVTFLNVILLCILTFLIFIESIAPLIDLPFQVWQPTTISNLIYSVILIIMFIVFIMTNNDPIRSIIVDTYQELSKSWDLLELGDDRAVIASKLTQLKQRLVILQYLLAVVFIIIYYLGLFRNLISIPMTLIVLLGIYFLYWYIFYLNRLNSIIPVKPDPVEHRDGIVSFFDLYNNH